MELKANELRIGNLVRYKNEILTIKGVREFDVYCKLPCDKWIDKNPIDLFKPITLTEEWLLKFGFKKWGSYNHLWKVKRNHICTISTAWGGFKVNGHSYFLVNIKYVHQLQNLYFSLTNKELTIK